MNTITRRGFTLIELLVVITVIVILVMITATIYRSVQVQAKDTQVTAVADKVGDATVLYITQRRNRIAPPAGLGSTAVIGAGPNCNGGSGGWFASGAYPCSLEDVLVLNKYLPSGVLTSLSQSTVFPNNTYNSNIIVDSFDDTNHRFMIWWRLESPSGAETANFTAQMQKCGINPAGSVSQRDTFGMSNAKCLSY